MWKGSAPKKQLTSILLPALFIEESLLIKMAGIG